MTASAGVKDLVSSQGTRQRRACRARGEGVGASYCRATSGGRKRCTGWCGRPFCAGFRPGKWEKFWNRCWGKATRRRRCRGSRGGWTRRCELFISAACATNMFTSFWTGWC
jgi:hypothetical protein